MKQESRHTVALLRVIVGEDVFTTHLFPLNECISKVEWPETSWRDFADHAAEQTGIPARVFRLAQLAGCKLVPEEMSERWIFTDWMK